MIHIRPFDTLDIGSCFAPEYYHCLYGKIMSSYKYKTIENIREGHIMEYFADINLHSYINKNDY